MEEEAFYLYGTIRSRESQALGHSNSGPASKELEKSTGVPGECQARAPYKDVRRAPSKEGAPSIDVLSMLMDHTLTCPPSLMSLVSG